MSTSTLSLQEQTQGLQERTLDIEQVSRVLEDLEERLAGLDAELDGCLTQRRKYQLLGTILDSLDELDAAGAVDLFWNRETTSYAPDDQLQQARGHIAAYQEKVTGIEVQRDQVQSEIDAETDNLRRLNSELVDIEEEVENLRHELAVSRDPSEIPYRPLPMPWSRNGEDDRRYRKVLLASLLISLSFGPIIYFFKPGHVAKQEEFIPDQVAQLVVKKKAEPPKPPEKSQEKRQDKPNERATAAARSQQPTQQAPVDNSPAPAPATNDTQAARAAAQTKGVLAHQNEFAGLLDSPAPAKVGAEGAVSNTGQIAAGTATTRSLIGSNASGGSGGINVAAISRDGDGGGGMGGGGTGTGGGGTGNGPGGGRGGGRITGGGVNVARVQSGTGTAVADARPLSNGTAPSRTDEEIQIVFDRYKAALYRIYNRELRNDPSLRGKMVLRLTIEPDGHVSACAVKSTDLASPALSADVVERVLKFDFGAKPGVPSITIVYPIDFLPAA